MIEDVEGEVLGIELFNFVDVCFYSIFVEVVGNLLL